MSKPKIALIVAAAKNNVIGFKGELPWVLKDDMALFRKITTGHPVVMGRKTMDALGNPLPNRTNIVISKGDVVLDGFTLTSSLEAAIALASQAPGSEVIYVIGGGQIYQQAMPLADILYVSRVDVEPTDGDAHFPDFSKDDWVQQESIPYPKNERNQFAFDFQTWVRR
jgi:dihydrofolate reductase